MHHSSHLQEEKWKKKKKKKGEKQEDSIRQNFLPTAKATARKQPLSAGESH